MRNVDLIELANNPDLISGIYNYCDRWCERCSFTTRCLLYATEVADESDDPAAHDIRNAAFWRKLESIFKQTEEMIVSWAEESGIDLDAADLETATKENEEQWQNARKNPLTIAAEEYAQRVSQWFELHCGQIETVNDTREIEPTNQEHDEDVNDAAEVIRWYQFLIAAKIVRGLLADADEEDLDYPENARGGDGSIKVALIAIDRSISGWRMMQLSLPEKAGSIIPMLVELERLRVMTEHFFPAARDFIRPGFDEAGLDVLQ